MGKRSFIHFENIEVDQIQFTLGIDRQGKTQIGMVYGPGMCDLNFVTPAAVTMWPRCGGDGNFGTLFGPADPAKTKFTLDLTDNMILGANNEEFIRFKRVMDAIDDKLLQFVTDNQLRILGRKNLSKEEIRMLQNRSVKPKYDKISGALSEHTFNMAVNKYMPDGMGGKIVRKVSVFDCNGKIVPEGKVCPGDVVRATAYVNTVYNGIGGGNFGISFGFEDVSVVAQRMFMDVKHEESAFFGGGSIYTFANTYENPYSEVLPEAPIFNGRIE